MARNSRPTKPYTARCIGCGGVFRVPKGCYLSLASLFAHQCPKAR